MALALIKLTYKHVIDATAQADFERNVFEATYQEFRIKSQPYNLDGDLSTFSQLREKDIRANSLHYKIGFAALHFLIPLNNKIPVLLDAMGNQLQYENAVFDLIESDLSQKNNHKVGIKFITGTYVLHQVIGDNLVLSLHDMLTHADESFDTFTLKIPANMAISSYKDISGKRIPSILNTSFNNN
ncbi:hypothetical protein [Mucilaginibacter agri]|uniref:Uncharacterized protein n=1 Tax=Mucilaginibacter agri TaxID=2695265 RepID=A0A966DUU3_9SPHI|nr:hypothetical protein [Mucilaginibacter agri]NCD70811.1 hypothetical protein [Mucilaginibacter agri]